MLYARVEGHIKEAKLDQAIDAAERFERMLCDEGALLFKFWFHLSKKQLKERLKALEKDPQHSWKLSPLDWKQSEVYDRFVHYGERVLRRTSRDYAPWYVVEGVDERYRALTVGRILLEGLQAALATKERAKRQPHAAPLVSSLDNRGLLDSLDLGQYLDKDAYKEQLAAEQARLAGLIRDKRFRQHSLVAVFEGNDAAGKGGAIRRVTDALDPRQYHIVPIAAPTEEERAQPISGASGGTFRRVASSPSSTVPGTAACWWSASRASAHRPTGYAPMARSMTSRSSSASTGSSW